MTEGTRASVSLTLDQIRRVCDAVDRAGPPELCDDSWMAAGDHAATMALLRARRRLAEVYNAAAAGQPWRAPIAEIPPWRVERIMGERRAIFEPQSQERWWEMLNGQN